MIFTHRHETYYIKQGWFKGRTRDCQANRGEIQVKNGVSKFVLVISLVVTLFLLLALVLCGCSKGKGAANPSPTSTSVLLNETKVPILVEGASNLGSLEFVLVYDPSVLKVNKVEKDTLSSNAMMESVNETPGRVWVGMVDSSGINGNGSLVVITFQVTGERINSQLALETVEAHNSETLLDIIYNTSPGNLTVKERSFTSPMITFTSR